MDKMIKGQPFAGQVIDSSIYYHTCVDYFDDLHTVGYGTRPCPSCGLLHTSLTEGGDGVVYGWCHTCLLVWDSHLLICECGNDKFQVDGNNVLCSRCGVDADSIQDLLYRLVG